ncbi:OLC1v1014067C1 [Oldenlandia corymbosa var. corymbosa]|uniref:OLC1v1014067C1 n=1 Tax=Oldenlandia corymbosa var. corymbosa TaxID=529605 RepID=A0AAV1E1Z5_OLDCO|nr:OLC1v1014067C1 [Oldenlandia corymbosa var. corymbosa]
MNMDSSAFSASIGSALHDLDLVLNQLSPSLGRIRRRKEFIFYLHSLKIFVLISSRNLDNQLLEAKLPSFLLRVEDTVHKLAQQFHHPDAEQLTKLDKSVADELLDEMESLHEEIDEWYFTMRDSLLSELSDSLFTIDDIYQIITSILELLEENYHRKGTEALFEEVKVLQSLISFVFKPTPQLLAHAKNVAIHTHLHFRCPRALGKSYEDFGEESDKDSDQESEQDSHEDSDGESDEESEEDSDGDSNAESDEESEEDSDEDSDVAEPLDDKWVQDSIFTWVQTIKSNDPLVCETYIQALNSSKWARKSVETTHHQHIDDGAFIATKNFLDSLIHNLWELLRLNSVCLLPVKDQMMELYRKFRSLRTILKQQQPTNNIKADIVSLLYDAGVLIFSLYQTDKEVDLGCFHDLLKTTKTILLQLGVEDPPVPEFNFPKTNQLGFVDFVLEKLVDLGSCEAEPTANSMHIQTIHEELLSLRSFLGDIVQFREKHEELQALWNRVLEVTCKVECLIDHLLAGDLPVSSPNSVGAILKDVKDVKLKIEVKRPEIEDKRQQNRLKEGTRTHTLLPSQTTSSGRNNEVVGFADDAKQIMGRLKRGPKQLKVITIVGMPGLGKTTLASKVYNDVSISLYFQVRAWCSISQALDKKNVLVQLLKQVDPNYKSDSELNEQDLVERLWRSLKGKRYLLYLDDIWGKEAWNSLAEAFPDDKCGSRILLTSRHQGVAPSHMLDQEPHFLQPLNEGESWELFRRKLFPGLYLALPDLVMKFVAYCKGLPLTIIIVAGILKNTEPEDWMKILEDLSSGDESVTRHCMDSLELSYKCLPDHLKPCLLYFGAFPEDAQIPTERLLYLWVAEGFIRKAEEEVAEGKRDKDVAAEKRIIDVAKDYLNGLIGRSLIMVSDKRLNGGVKKCRIHDLLLDYCLQKSKDDHFLHLVKGNELLGFNEPCNLRRLSIHSTAKHFKQSKLFCPRARSLLFQAPPSSSYQASGDASFVIGIFKLLRVLDLEGINLWSEFPSEISLLVQLTFLAIQGDFTSIPSCIAKLSNLETLIVDPMESISLPDSLWNLQKLKYLRIKDEGGIVPIGNLDNLPILYELDVFCGACIPYDCSLERLMTKFPNIRKLRCWIGLDEDDESEYPHAAIVVPDFLTQLESAQLSWDAEKPELPKGLELSFPENLKELKLHGFELSGENMSTIGKLPNLQVLKLSGTKLEDETWEMREGEFSELRVLKLEDMELVRWIADDDQLKCLQKLVLEGCTDLEEMPCNCLENIQALETIEVFQCSDAIEELVRQIEEQQKEGWGNLSLQIEII